MHVSRTGWCEWLEFKARYPLSLPPSSRIGVSASLVLVLPAGGVGDEGVSITSKLHALSRPVVMVDARLDKSRRVLPFGMPQFSMRVLCDL